MENRTPDLQIRLGHPVLYGEFVPGVHPSAPSPLQYAGIPWLVVRRTNLDLADKVSPLRNERNDTATTRTRGEHG